jgi:hypothetical protein
LIKHLAALPGKLLRLAMNVDEVFLDLVDFATQ